MSQTTSRTTATSATPPAQPKQPEDSTPATRTPAINLATGTQRRWRTSLRERAAAALDDDWPQVLAALRRGLDDKDAGKAARTAVVYVELVYGRQLQQPMDEQPADPLDVASRSREERDALKPFT